MKPPSEQKKKWGPIERRKGLRKPLIDVHVVSFGHPVEWADKCLRSVKEQAIGVKIRVCLQGSWWGDMTRGTCESRNRTAGLGVAPWMLFLDGDDWLADGCLAELWRVAEESDADVIYPSIITHIEPGHSQHSWPGQPKKFLLKKLINFNYIPVTALMKREWFEKVGGFDENMLDGFEDWELWLRMALAGAEFQFAPDAYLMYRQHDGGRSIEAGKKVEEIVAYIRNKHKDECAAWMNLHNKG